MSLALAALAFAAAGCGGKKDAAAPVDAASCSEVVYEGKGAPDAIVVSDLPRRGYGKETATLMIEAIEFVLERRDYRAGDLRIGYQSCNDTVGEEPYDRGLCERNAKAYAASEDVLGVIGPWNSGCAALQIPLLSRKQAGPLAMISPSNTYIGFTRKSLGRPEEPLVFYPDGLRNYVRVVPPDNEEAAAVVLLAKTLGAKRVVSVSAPDDYGQGLSRPFVIRARAMGMQARDFAWRRQRTFAPLAGRVAAAKPQLVYLAGTPDLNGRRLLEDLRGRLGGKVAVVGSAGFFLADPAQLGPAGVGMLIAVGGIPAEKLPPAGRSFLRAFGKPAFNLRQGAGAPEAAQSAEVLLDAIGRSDGSRASVVNELFKSDVKNGILGSFRFDPNGDIDPATVGFFRVGNGKVVVDRVVRVAAEPG